MKSPRRWWEWLREYRVSQDRKVGRQYLERCVKERLGSTPKDRKVKVRVALRLRRQTTVSYEWTAERLKREGLSNTSNVYAKQTWQK